MRHRITGLGVVGLLAVTIGAQEPPRVPTPLAPTVAPFDPRVPLNGPGAPIPPAVPMVAPPVAPDAPLPPPQLIPAVPAPAPAEPVNRLVWEHAEGLCRFVDKGEDNWVEMDVKNGTVSFRFKEVKRNSDYVELYDKDRGYTLRFYKNAMYMKGGLVGPPFEDFTKYYDGRWVK